MEIKLIPWRENEEENSPLASYRSKSPIKMNIYEDF